MASSPYTDLFSRLVANTSEPEWSGGCWPWTAKRDRWYYGRVNVYVPGLRKVVILMAHICAWVWIEARCACADDLWLAYQELQASGLELDHLCTEPTCINPDHHDPVTGAENCKRRDQRARTRHS